jgi:hypothetical protein
LIQDYNPNSVYEIRQEINNGKTRKIAEIHNNVCYDIDRKGQRTLPGFRFVNSESFWNQFGKISIRKIDRPLYGFEPIVWGAYWTLHVLGTIIVVVAVPEAEKIGYFLTSALVFFVTVKYRYNKYVVYLMAAVAIIFVIFLWRFKPNKK